MSKHTWLISDSHFTHSNSLKFVNARTGERMRPHWETVEEMDEDMIQRWNSVVTPKCKIYHLGDFSIARRNISIAARLNGDKVLIKGNHDIFKLHEYTPYFRDIRASHVLDKCVLSHIPVHPSQIARFKGNIHGHLHENRVLGLDGNIDPNYFSVCVEQINYTPIEFSEAIKRLQKQQEVQQ